MAIKLNVVDNNSSVKLGTIDNTSNVKLGTGTSVNLKRLELLIKNLEETKQNLGFIVIDEYVFEEQQRGVIPQSMLNLLTSYLVNKLSYNDNIYSLSKINEDNTYEYISSSANPNTIRVNIIDGHFEIYHTPYIDRDHASLLNLDYLNSGHTGFAGIITKTTSEWNSDPQYQTIKDIIYVYSDYAQDEQGNDIPGIKLGDGNAYLIDKPFLGTELKDALLEHLENTVVHITQAERESWNHKITCDDSIAQGSDMLVFTRN